MLGIKAFYSRLSPKDDMPDNPALPEAAPIGEGRGRAEDRPLLGRLRLSRRSLLVGVTLGGVGLAGGASLLRSGSAQAPVIGPGSPLVAATERARRRSGRTVDIALTAAAGTVDLAGRKVEAFLYDGQLPGKEIRVSKGDLLNVSLRNDLPEMGSIHWHGLTLRNDMDGVPGLTQKPIAAGASFRYSFVVPEAGTYWFHSHSGLQLEKGLYAPLVVEDPAEPAVADVEAVLVLDDWAQGVGPSPEAIYADLQANGMAGMGGMGMGGMPTAAQPLGTDGGDVPYPLHLVNGRPPEDPYVVEAKPGQRVRLRLINAGADSAYRFAVGGHRLTVTHADGFAVQPVEVNTLVIGMGERYDVVVTAGSGVFPIAVVRESKADPPARALLRTGPGATPALNARPAELDGRLLAYADLRPTDAVALPSGRPDVTFRYALGMQPSGYVWTINDRVYADRVPERVRMGQRVRLEFTNASMMFHPMHLHGHTFALAGTGARKDTVNVAPMQTLSVDVQADNPGQWMIHCHNAFHLESGMATSLSYVH